MASRKLTKAEIIEHIHEQLGVNSNDVHQVLDQFFVELKQGLQEDKVIELRGFGTFEIRTRKGRDRARNPKTGEVVAVDTHGVAVFRPGKELKDLAWDLRD
jgi:integration host factor subunit beta